MLDGTVSPPGFLARAQDFISVRCFSSPVAFGKGTEDRPLHVPVPSLPPRLGTGPCVSLSPHPKTCFKLPE